VNEVSLKGWGYTYLKISDIEPGMTTMMACPGPKVEKFVSLRAPEKLIRRYNSLSPLVVYVPEEYTLKYRFWSASDEVQDAVKR
jgi:ecotin